MESILHQKVSNLELYKYLSYQETKYLHAIICREVSLLPFGELVSPYYDRPVMKRIFVSMQSHYMEMVINIMDPNSPQICGNVIFYYTKDDFLLSESLYLIKAGYRQYN